MDETIATEARAKIVWGEPAQQVIEFLLTKEVSQPEARAFVEQLVSERSLEIRREGVRRIWTGAALTLLPVGYYLISTALEFVFL